jgi:DNA invertase Pin-like site-specific DNA recombinase
MRVKYIRWSTINQTGARQLLDADNYDLILKEQASGTVAFDMRPKGSKLLSMIREGKVTDLFVEEFSRLGRNAYDTLTTLQVCEEYEINVHIQNMHVSSRIRGKLNPIFKMFSHIFTVIAEQEKEAIKERTEMGKIAARERGVVFGRKQGSNERKIDFLAKERSKMIFKLLKAGKNSIRQISKLTDSSTSTVLKVKAIAIETKQLAASK